MRSLRTTVAMAVSVAALVSVRTSFAEEPQTTVSPNPSTPTAQRQQPAPPPGQQEPVQQAPVQPRTTAGDPAPTSTTRTTQAQYVPAGDRVTERTIEKRPNSTLLSTGVGLFVISYGSSVVGGALSNRDADKRLFIPVVGPWMNLAQRGCTGSTPCGENEDVAKAMIVTSGVVQGASLLLALGSLIVPETVRIRERTKTAGPSVKVLPVSFGAGAGIGAVGRF
jgi:hypothetical protein